jgi:hypothetical protein
LSESLLAEAAGSEIAQSFCCACENEAHKKRQVIKPAF